MLTWWSPTVTARSSLCGTPSASPIARRRCSAFATLPFLARRAGQLCCFGACALSLPQDTCVKRLVSRDWFCLLREAAAHAVLQPPGFTLCWQWLRDRFQLVCSSMLAALLLPRLAVISLNQLVSSTPECMSTLVHRRTRLRYCRCRISHWSAIPPMPSSRWAWPPPSPWSPAAAGTKM